MSLSLYRRHSRVPGKCAGGHQPDAQTYESGERRRAWKRCSCPIYASGTIGGHFRRVNTKQVAWDEAKTVAAGWEAAGDWPVPTTRRSGDRVISQLIAAESPNRWRLSIEYEDFSEPLRKTVVIAHVELRELQISDVRYSHHEECTRATSHSIWQAPVHAVHKESQQLRDDLMRAATLVWGIRIQASRGVGPRE